MNKVSPPSPAPGAPETPQGDVRPADPPKAGDAPGSAGGSGTTAQDSRPPDGRGAALDADLGELILLIGRIRRDLEGGNPLHCPDMKPLSRRAERIVGLIPQLPRAEAQPLLPRLERVMNELDAVEERLRVRRAELDRALREGTVGDGAPEGQRRR